MKNLFLTTLMLSAFVFSCQEQDGMKHDMHKEDHMDHMDHMAHSGNHSSAPIGVVGNMHHMGWMLGIKQGHMYMSGNSLDGNSISNSEILQIPNEISSMPANLSVIPKNMDMQMTMVEAMYAPTQDITYMVMCTYLSKDMALKSYSAMMDRDLIGQFNTSSSDLSDITLSAFFVLSETGDSKWHGEVSYQKSIGKNNDKDQVLTPMGTYMNMILPYAMQSSDKATRLTLGLTNSKKIKEKTTWSNQARFKKVIHEKGWAFGDQIELNSWLQYQYLPNLSISTRLKLTNQGEVSGANAMITAPVQTANPENYGGSELHVGFGANYNLDLFANGNDMLGVEVLFPVIQEKYNLQMDTKYQIVVGYKKSF